jgi:hypothetical protein
MFREGWEPRRGYGTGMRNEIADLFRHDGPFTSVYLDAQSDQPQAQQALETHWKTVRAALSAEGAGDDDLAAIDAAVADRTHIGGDTLAVIAAGGEVLLARHLPEPPRGDGWRLGLLPWVGPLVETAQTLLPHVIVIAERNGAEIYGFDASGRAVEQEVTTTTNDNVELINAGGWSQRRYERRQVNTWEENAREVADEVASIAKQVSAHVIGVRGDVHAVRLLRDSLPAEVAPLMRSLDDHGVGEPTRLVDTVVAEETVALLEQFKAGLGQGTHAVDGPEETLDALQKANVATLLVHDDATDDRMAWFGTDPTHLALDDATVRAMGAEHVHPARLIDVCLRAAYGTSADVRVVPSAVVTDGLAALLRW